MTELLTELLTALLTAPLTALMTALMAPATTRRGEPASAELDASASTLDSTP